MGCDIHLHQETKINGKWHHYGAPRIGRNYDLFAKMAGVRRTIGSPLPIAAPRGLPEDATELTLFDWRRWTADWHTASWLGAEEIAELQDWLEEQMGDRKWALEIEYWGYLFGGSWGGFRRFPNDRPKGLEDVRFVFWFDD